MGPELVDEIIFLVICEWLKRGVVMNDYPNVGEGLALRSLATYDNEAMAAARVSMRRHIWSLKRTN